MTTAQASTTTRFVNLYIYVVTKSIWLHFNFIFARQAQLVFFFNLIVVDSIPQVSQLYYDANTGIYYYYDAESGRYQFHSRIEVPAAQTVEEPYQDKSAGEKKGGKLKKGFKKASKQDNKVGNARMCQ